MRTKKMTRQIVKTALLSVILCSLFNCASSSDEGKNSPHETIVKGFLSATTESSAVSSRTALPVIPENIFYTVEAENQATSEKFNAVVYNEDRIFEIKLTKGTWSLTAKGYCDEEKTKLCFQGATSVTINELDPVVDDIFILLRPLQDSTGSVKLTLNIENACGIQSLIAEWQDSSSVSQTINFSSDSAIFNMNTETGIQPGAYTVSFKFYGSADGNGALLYYCRETVNVFDNLKTDTWINNGNKLYLTEDSAGNTIFKITKELIENFKMTSFFVQGTSGTYTPHLDAADTNNGTYFDPLATVQKAVQKCADRSKTTPCSIFIDGTITETGCSVIEENANISIIKFQTDSEITKIQTDSSFIENSGSLILEDINTTGNIIFKAGSLTLKGTTTLGTITLDSAGLWITADGLSEETLTVANVTMTNENASYADITYKKDDAILKAANGTTLTQADCNKFPLTSPYFVLTPNSDGTKGILSNSEGTIIPEIEKEISFTLDKSEYSRGEKITISASLTNSAGTKSDCTEDMTDWNISITNHGSDTGTSNTSGTDNTITIPDGTTEIKNWPEDTYTVTVSAKYQTENLLYSASFEIQITEVTE